jgi:hypothetical protein
MTISNFEDLLQAAAQQPEPQRMLFVFVAKGPPDDWSADKAASFRAGSGGTLTPVVCVDKAVAEIASFAALAEESKATGEHWDIVLVACLAGRNGLAPTASEVDQGLEAMIDAVKTGSELWRFLAFDRHGEPLQLSHDPHRRRG